MKQPTKCLLAFVHAVCLIVLVSVATVDLSVAAEPKAGTWSAGAAIGFLGKTPDGTAFATNLHADYFLNHQVSVGPLAQFAVTGDLFQVGVSGQGKYWLNLPGVDNRLKVNLQGGLGFLYADRHSSDASWLIPIGVGVDYALNEQLSLMSTFLLNFTDVDTGRRSGATVMPGLTFGVRF
ncbi:MAG: porin family protein [Nitrospirae bacterium]|nr:MAG: porin family protein [Nitrospirota bacterium]